nr:unnamed protein product [Digitaria exilis]
MAAAGHPSPILFLCDRVNIRKYTDEPEQIGWKKMECASKRSYGCGQHGKEAVDGLTLYACPGDESPLTSSLAIRMTDEASRRFDSEIQLTCKFKDMLVHYRMIAGGIVLMADEQQGLTVILLSFSRPSCQDLAYYLVYDKPTASLSLIHYVPVPDLFEYVCTAKPVAKRHKDSDGFELFVVGREVSPVPRRILCACTPETRVAASDNTTGPWLIKKPFEHEEFIKEPFIVDVAFTFQSKYGIWGDLSRGLMYCGLLDTKNDFGFIGLPTECLVDSEDEFDEKVKTTRTMSCVGDSIWFVCIDRHATDPKDDLVKMWTLKGGNLFQNHPRWEKMVEVCASELWGFDGFDEARLPRGLPLEYPLLTEDEQNPAKQISSDSGGD